MIIKAIATKTANVMAYGNVDANGSRYLLSDSAGMMHLLVLVHDNLRVHALKLEPLGGTSIASSLSYLDNGVDELRTLATSSSTFLTLVHRVERHPMTRRAVFNLTLVTGVVYVGSAYGDSQLVRLHAHPIGAGAASTAPALGSVPDSGYVEVLESFTNLGPIVDFVVVDLERHGQGQVVTCSGVHKAGPGAGRMVPTTSSDAV